MQPVDFTTLTAACCELRAHWLPARLEQVYQRDRYTLCLAVRTLEQRGWLTLCWHPQAAHLCLGDPPPRSSDTFTFSQQLRHQLNGLALVGMIAIAPWERVIDLQFAHRPGEPPLWHLYAEVMGKYSNVILVNQDNLIVTAAHQVGSQQSSVRPVQTGEIYLPPPSLNDPMPSVEESQDRWQDRVALVPGSLQRNLLKSYRGLSSALAASMAQAANLNPDQSTETLSQEDWQRLFQRWQEWLKSLQQEQFHPGWRVKGYTVLGWGALRPAPNLQTLLNQYYKDQLNQQQFKQLHHQISQKLARALEKIRLKGQVFQTRLNQSTQADQYRQQADLLMAHLQNWQPGMNTIILPDFETGNPIKIDLGVEKNAVQNAQALYKQHQKLKRARTKVQPLLAATQTEINYLEQVEAAIEQLDQYRGEDDLLALEEIREELIQQGYLGEPDYRRPVETKTEFYRYQTPGGLELLIGRNNRQNDQLTFRIANTYDLWFHSQEIAGSHVLLRLRPGLSPDASDLQFAADCAAYYSRARQSQQVPVVYTQPRQVYKPKRAKPGMAIYKDEQVLWGQPQAIEKYLAGSNGSS